MTESATHSDETIGQVVAGRNVAPTPSADWVRLTVGRRYFLGTIAGVGLLLSAMIVLLPQSFVASNLAFPAFAAFSSFVAAFAIAGAARAAQGRSRVGWWVLCASVSLIGAVTAVWPLYYGWGAQHGWNEAAIFRFYTPAGPLQIIGYGLLLSVGLSRAAFFRRLLDVAIITIATLVMLHEPLLRPALEAAPSIQGEIYPLASGFIVLAFLLGNFPRMSRDERTRFFPLVLGLVFHALGDTTKLLAHLQGGFFAPQALSVGWILGMVGVAVTAHAWKPLTQVQGAPSRWGTEIYPVLIGGAAAVYATFRAFLGHGPQMFELWAILALFSLAVVRQGIHVAELMTARHGLRAAASDATRNRDKALKAAFELEAAHSLANLMKWDMDVSTGTVTLSPEFASFLGFVPNRMVLPVERLAKMGPPATESAWKGAHEQVLATGKAQTFALEMRDEKWNVHHLYARMALAPGDSDRSRIMGVAYDFTAVHDAQTARAAASEREQQLKAAKEQSAFKTHLLNAASHELNTPLSAMKLQLYLHRQALGAEATPQHQRSLELMDRNLARLTKLINETLDVSRLQAGNLTITTSDVSLAQIVTESLAILQPLASQAGVTLLYKENGPVRMEADPARLAQVLFNLVGNAVKYAPPKSIIHVRVNDSDEMVRCAVQDAGVGMEPEQIARLFQPFSQVQTENVQKGGTGLGLYISKGIVEQHGGRLWCESAGRGKGTTFVFEVPRHRAEQPAPVEAPIEVPVRV